MKEDYKINKTKMKECYETNKNEINDASSQRSKVKQSPNEMKLK